MLGGGSASSIEKLLMLPLLGDFFSVPLAALMVASSAAMPRRCRRCFRCGCVKRCDSA